MLSLVAPKLTFAEPEIIGEGVTVNPIDFAAARSSPPFKATIFEVLPGKSTPLDQHKVEECWIVLNGSGLLEYDGQERFVREHDVLYFASQKSHQVHNQSDESLVICSLYW